MTIHEPPLAGLVALVTGGSRGIGRAICLRLGAAGAAVVVNYHRQAEAAQSVVAAIEANGGRAMAMQFDVGDPQAVNAAVPQILAAFGTLDILVNNAGVAINGLVMRFKDEAWQELLRTNLSGALHCVRACSPALLKAKSRGRVINIASIVGDTGNAGQAGYAATKAGLVGMTKSLAREFASRGVTVNVVSPGFIESDMTQAAMAEQARAKLLEEVPLARLGTPDDVAAVVAFLAGPEAGYITGQEWRVNGGLLM